MEFRILRFFFLFLVCSSCYQKLVEVEKTGKIRIIQLDPTHSHAAVAQSNFLSCIDTNVYVYAPDKNAVDPYFEQINSFNTRKEHPTRWNEISYFGKDYLEKMINEKKGSVVVLAGNNRTKIDHIEQSVNAGMNVFSDKPMVINQDGFERLEIAYEQARQKRVLLFDMMTERYSLINRVQRSLMQDSLLFGQLINGTADHPAIMESSVHHFYRGGKGSRPAWYFDVEEQGEGIVNVTTHLIDLIFWKGFPDEIIDYKSDLKVLSAREWPIQLTKEEFSAATSLNEIPSSLNRYIKDSVLQVYANGKIIYRIKEVYSEVKVEWRATMPEGGNDLRNAYAEGTKSTLLIRQEYGQKRPKLFIQKSEKISPHEFETNLNQALIRLQTEYPGISLSKEAKSVEIIMPSELENSYVPIFTAFIGYLKNKDLPEWEVPNTLAKYYITTTALKVAKEKSKT